MSTGSAPAKIILFGEHAVVHGVPALAAPVSSLRAFAETTPMSSGGVHIQAPGFADSLPVGFDVETVDNALTLTVRLVLRELNAPPPNLTIGLRSDIPIASGMGSGAAVSAAVARAICANLGVDLPLESLNHLVYEVEKLHHGTPSGIDNTVIVYEKPVYFVRGHEPLILNVGMPIQLLIGDTGRPSSTREAVAGVWTLLDQKRDRVTVIFDIIQGIVAQARDHIESGTPHLLGTLMTQNHALLQELTVSSPELDCLVSAALDAGALGAKLSGGGRGGIMIALVEDSTRAAVESALRAAGAVNVILTEVK